MYLTNVGIIFQNEWLLQTKSFVITSIDNVYIKFIDSISIHQANERQSFAKEPF